MTCLFFHGQTKTAKSECLDQTLRGRRHKSAPDAPKNCDGRSAVTGGRFLETFADTEHLTHKRPFDHEFGRLVVGTFGQASLL